MLEDTADVMMGHPSMIIVLAYVSFLHGKLLLNILIWFLVYTAHVSGCLIKRSPSTYVGLPSTDRKPEKTYYGCVSGLLNCDYEVHVIANYESSNGHHGYGIRRKHLSTYVHFNINGQSSKPLVLVFTSYEPVNWRLSLPSGVVVNRILVVS